MGVVCGITLRDANTVRIMAGITGRLRAINMASVFGKTLIVKNAVATVASVTECVSGATLRRIVQIALLELWQLPQPMTDCYVKGKIRLGTLSFTPGAVIGWKEGLSGWMSNLMFVCSYCRGVLNDG